MWCFLVVALLLELEALQDPNLDYVQKLRHLIQAVVLRGTSLRSKLGHVNPALCQYSSSSKVGIALTRPASRRRKASQSRGLQSAVAFAS